MLAALADALIAVAPFVIRANAYPARADVDLLRACQASRKRNGRNRAKC